jgi:septum site-determining protein MinC
MANDIITIKGIKDGLQITVSETDEWQAITREMATRIDERLDFFVGARVTLEVGERPVPKYELSSVKALLERRQLTLVVVSTSSSTTIESANALDLRTSIPEALRQTQTTAIDEDALPIDPEEQGTLGVMIKRTLRSGRTVHSRGHVVVYGDVNPGAQIIASGDVIIWGKLRGTVHAGAEGDHEAVVCALDMSPNQLRIAEFIVTSPDKRRRKITPEIARVQGEQIIVEEWGP